jgi:hypothetical protein
MLTELPDNGLTGNATVNKFVSFWNHHRLSDEQSFKDGTIKRILTGKRAKDSNRKLAKYERIMTRNDSESQIN